MPYAWEVGPNHRTGLSDGVLLKDNHIGAAGSVTPGGKNGTGVCALRAED